MNKAEFLLSLRQGMEGLPKDEVEASLAFYSEIIDDMVEDGLSEEEAVLKMGSVDSIISQIISEISIAKIVKERVTPKRKLSKKEITFIAISSPIWVSLFAAGIAIAISIYATIWSVLISLWAVFVSIAACGLGTIAGGIVISTVHSTATGLALISVGIFLCGLAIFAFFGCKTASKATCFVTHKLTMGIKNMFVRKEKAE